MMDLLGMILRRVEGGQDDSGKSCGDLKSLRRSLDLDCLSVQKREKSF